MSFELPALPYEKDALAPHISAETLSIHHGKHHAGYVNKLNAAVAADAGLQGKSLEELVGGTQGGVFNNAAQVWNHAFYWNSMSPDGGGEAGGELGAAITEAFGSIEDFVAKFSAVAGGQFGSGWGWLCSDGDGRLSVTSTSNAGTPLTEGLFPLLTCDVWEHAYYVDYRNARPDYIEAWWKLVNWDFAAANYSAAKNGQAWTFPG
jgi:Fe-Mn family superoxide dismutase